MLDWLQTLDRELFLYLNGHHNRYWDIFMMMVSGKIIWGALYLVVIAVIFNRFGVKKGFLVLACVILVAVFCDQVTASIFKPAFKRFRPSRSPILGNLVHIVDGYRGGKYGFASSHAANTFGLAVFISLLFKHRATSLFFVLWAFLVSYSRIYLGVHYPGDVIVGGLIGALSACFVYYFYNKYISPLFPKEEKIYKEACLYPMSALGTVQIMAMLLYVLVVK